MEDQENSFHDEINLKNETEMSSNEYESKNESNETEADLDSELEKNQTKNTSLSEEDDGKINDDSYSEKNEQLDTKTEAKNIEILDFNQRSADDIDRPFSYSPQQVSKSENNGSQIESKRINSPKENSTSQNKKFNKEEFLPENTDQSFFGLNSQKLTKSTSISDSTESKLKKKFIVYQRQPQKAQFKNLSEQNLYKSINRLSAVPDRNLEPYKIKTIHDRVKDIDIDAVSLRLYSSKIRNLLTFF